LNGIESEIREENELKTVNVIDRITLFVLLEFYNNFSETWKRIDMLL
jgi:hypothetical protein